MDAAMSPAVIVYSTCCPARSRERRLRKLRGGSVVDTRPARRSFAQLSTASSALPMTWRAARDDGLKPHARARRGSNKHFNHHHRHHHHHQGDGHRCLGASVDTCTDGGGLTFAPGSTWILPMTQSVGATTLTSIFIADTFRIGSPAATCCTAATIRGDQGQHVEGESIYGGSVTIRGDQGQHVGGQSLCCTAAGAAVTAARRRAEAAACRSAEGNGPDGGRARAHAPKPACAGA